MHYKKERMEVTRHLKWSKLDRLLFEARVTGAVPFFPNGCSACL